MAGRKESALDLARFIDKGVRVKLAGGREGEEARGVFARYAKTAQEYCCCQLGCRTHAHCSDALCCFP